jgi:hypothetical protein
MTTETTSKDSSERASADILLRTALGTTAVLGIAFVIILVTAPGPDELISQGQVFGTLVGLLAILIGVPCWIALGIRTILRTRRP